LLKWWVGGWVAVTNDNRCAVVWEGGWWWVGWGPCGWGRGVCVGGVVWGVVGVVGWVVSALFWGDARCWWCCSKVLAGQSYIQRLLCCAAGELYGRGG